MADYSDFRKQRYSSRTEQHLCVQCGKRDERTERGMVLCQRCADYQRNYAERTNRKAGLRADYKLLRKYHFCVQCRKQDAYTMAGRALCAECAEKYASRQRQRRHHDAAFKTASNEKHNEYKERLKVEHRCVDCARTLPKNWAKRRCPSCLASMRDKSRRKARAAGVISREEAVSNGLCFLCCKEPAIPGKKICAGCYAKNLLHLDRIRKETQDIQHPWKQAGIAARQRLDYKARKG